MTDTGLCADAQVIGWSEGLHNKAEYLSARNEVLLTGVRAGRFRLIAAETNAAASSLVDACLAGEVPLSAAVVQAMWSWFPEPLAHNAALLRALCGYNRTVPVGRRVRFRGLDLYGGAAPDLPDHRTGPGQEFRDAAQYRNLRDFTADYPGETVFLFEQTEHLDPFLPGSLGSHLARGGLGRYVSVGAVWREGEPGVRYPLGPYAGLSRRLAGAHDGRTIVDGVTLHRPHVGHSTGPFDAVLFADRLSTAPVATDLG